MVLHVDNSCDSKFCRKRRIEREREKDPIASEIHGLFIAANTGIPLPLGWLEKSRKILVCMQRSTLTKLELDQSFGILSFVHHGDMWQHCVVSTNRCK